MEEGKRVDGTIVVWRKLGRLEDIMCTARPVFWWNRELPQNSDETDHRTAEGGSCSKRRVSVPRNRYHGHREPRDTTGAK